MSLEVPPEFSSNINFHFLTIRFHPNDIPLFNNCLMEHIVPFCESCSHFYWCVENDNTKSMHFHAVIGHAWRDVGALQQKFKSIVNKMFKGIHHETLWDNKFKGQSINISSRLDNFRNCQRVNTLGYVQKEKSQNPRKSTNFSDDTLEKNLNYYLNSLSIKSNVLRHKETIINLTGTTILTNLLDFLIISELNLENLTWDELENLAIDHGYSFINVSCHMKLQTDKELRRRNNKSNDGYSYNTLQGVVSDLTAFCTKMRFQKCPSAKELIYDLCDQFDIFEQKVGLPENSIKSNTFVQEYFQNFPLFKNSGLS